MIERSFGTRNPRDIEQPQFYASRSVAQLGSGRARDLGDLLHGADQHPNPVTQQRAVGRVMDVGLHHRRIHTHSASLRHPLLLRDLHDPVVDLSDCLPIHSQAPAPHRLGVRHLAAAHTGEVAIHQIGAHFTFQHVIAPVANMLEDQQPQHHLGRRAQPTTTAALGMSSRQRLVHRTDDLFIRQNPVSMGHPTFAKIAHFPGDQAVAEAQLRSAHLNHVSSSPAAPPHQGATGRD